METSRQKRENMDNEVSMREEAKRQRRAVPVEKPWSLSWEETAEKLKVSPEKGLDSREARKRRQQYGLNRLRGTRTKPVWVILVDQFKNPIVALLGGASVLALAHGGITASG